MARNFRTDRPPDREERRASVIDDVEVDRGAYVENDRDLSLRTSSGAEFGRIGRRGPFRPEVLVLLAGAAFLIAALVKPWSGPPPTTGGSISPALVAAASGSATASGASASAQAGATATPTIDIYQLIPPYDYRPGQWPPPTPAATFGAISGAVASPWSHVDWSFLANLDTHDRWGVSALTFPAVAPASGQPNPSVSWAAEVAPWSPSNLTVPLGSAVYALALTWPSSLEVTSVSFDYLNLGDPRVGVTPVPAAAVATPATDGKPSPAPSSAGGGAPLMSGTFWIAPSGDLRTPPQALEEAWQSSPWAWPQGMYRVTLASNAGTMLVVLKLSNPAPPAVVPPQIEPYSH